MWLVLDGSGDEDFLSTAPTLHDQNENCLLNQRRSASNAVLELEMGYHTNLWSNPSRFWSLSDIHALGKYYKAFSLCSQILLWLDLRSCPFTLLITFINDLQLRTLLSDFRVFFFFFSMTSINQDHFPLNIPV